MRDLPHLTYLQAFEAAARLLSFTRAAEELNCTQAAISQRVRGLEQYFGRPLFHRRSNGLELSSAGKAYLPGVAQALDTMEAATRGLTGRAMRRTLTVSAPISFTNLWLSPRLPDFLQSCPDVSLRLNSSIWTDPNLDLADVSLGVNDRGLLPPGAAELAPAPLVLVGPADAPSTVRRQIDVQGKAPLWDLWQNATGARPAHDLPPIQVDTADTALRLAAAGVGHTVVYLAYAANLIDKNVLRGGAVADVGHVLFLRRHPDRTATLATRSFAQWVSASWPDVER